MELTKKERKELVKIGLELEQLTPEDVLFIMDPNTTARQANQRMVTARIRKCKEKDEEGKDDEPMVVHRRSDSIWR